ncbi:unnamed protein product [Rotaria sp. Silwood1]|nr:unnamed protein product [Rotaria sp. Silwood1]CAF3846832.1 unnamed protein product [Rotaria sp. Silwood1]CAF4829238.1 unnamed protein product [Rotaria sp. Silwood1]CAF5001310.1 unnamed protein product [Rotaria sp. Silwood1]
MHNSLIHLPDLPDEILLIIFKKLNNVELLYSLTNVNKRLQKIVHDSIFTSHLTLLHYFSKDYIYPLLDPIVDRFCLHILPEIYHKIKWLNLESLTMERILRSTNYPNLYGLGLYNIPNETALRLFNDETCFIHIFKNQISSLVINSINSGNERLTEKMDTLVFTHIFIVFTNLQYLNFHPFSIYFPRLSFDISSPIVFCSTLLELYVNVECFTDCLYLLDGRFNQLQTLHVNITRPVSLDSTINNKEKLPNLRYFSLYCDRLTVDYDELILPLLQRMSNLEQLDLHIVAIRDDKFIDGNDLKKNIINNMPQLNKFEFNIHSNVSLDNQNDLPSNEDIQKTFKDFKNSLVISCIDFFPSISEGQCHIYSYPYKISHYNNITNNFPGGLFKYVSEVSLYDERPFEHEFFIRIEKSFPFMKKLKVDNQEPQSNKQCYESRNNNRNLSIIKYTHLTDLYLDYSHDDYAEQFLLDFKMSLPNNVYLHINYESLQRVTHMFTRDATRINCGKLAHLHIYDGFPITKELEDYFPLVEIHSFL